LRGDHQAVLNTVLRQQVVTSSAMPLGKMVLFVLVFCYVGAGFGPKLAPGPRPRGQARKLEHNEPKINP
jgi:hypothetical protein